MAAPRTSRRHRSLNKQNPVVVRYATSAEYEADREQMRTLGMYLVTSSQAPDGHIRAVWSSDSRYARRTPVTSSAFEPLLVQPATFAEAAAVVGELRSGRPVAVSLDRLDAPTVQRVHDFFDGYCSAATVQVTRRDGQLLLVPVAARVSC
jgi:FtsZ-interacting cell division protein YlmF